MENDNDCDFQITQNGVKYVVNLSLVGDTLKINCYEYQSAFNNEFSAEFYHDQLKQYSQIFNSTTSIQDDFLIFKKAIQSKQVKIIKNPNNEINLTFFFEENESTNGNINLPLEINENFNNTSVEILPARRLPTISYKLDTVRIRRPTIYIDDDGKEISKLQFQNINNINNNRNLINSQNIQFISSPIPNKKIIHNKTFTPVKQVKKFLSPPKQNNNNYNNIINSPPREKIDFINNGSPSKNELNYSFYNRNNNNNNNNNNFFINDIDAKSFGSFSPAKETDNNSNYNIEYEAKINELNNKLKGISNEFENQKMSVKKLLQTIDHLKKDNDELKQENYILKQNLNKSIKDENDLIKKQLLETKNKYINEYEEYKKKKEGEMEELINRINILETENKKLKIEAQTIRTISINRNDSKLRVIKGDIIENNKELEFLTSRICKDHRKITLNLLYKARVDSDKAQEFHRRCDNTNNSLVLVKTDKGKRFGGFTSCSWAGDCIEKEDENAFIFSLDKMKIYDVKPDENAIGCFPNFGPVFLGCQIRIYDEAFKNGGSTYEKGLNYQTEENYELTDGEQKFNVEEIEVYGIDLEE